MKLKSMKLDKSSISSEKLTAEANVDRPAYPWGLSISLDSDALEKLGIRDNLPEVGSTMKLEANVSVTGVSENKSLGGGEYCNVQLQITDMALGTAKNAEDELYKK